MWVFSLFLGPALAYAIAMASNYPGSKIMVCTDGLANVGIGNLETAQNLRVSGDNHGEEDEVHTPPSLSRTLAHSLSFGCLHQQIYTKLGQLAKKHGVTVNVISIRGDDCSMENLGAMADLTSGQVDIVDPLRKQSNFNFLIVSNL